MPESTRFYLRHLIDKFDVKYNERSKELLLIGFESESNRRIELRLDSLQTRALSELMRLAEREIGGLLGSEPTKPLKRH